MNAFVKTLGVDIIQILHKIAVALLEFQYDT